MVGPAHRDPPGAFLGPLPGRGAEILAELGKDTQAVISFAGLRRRLSVHQQSLTRTLRRLMADGLVAKDSKGYRLTSAGSELVQVRATEDGSGEVITLIEALLPARLAPIDVTARLARRWFHHLRWYGQRQGAYEDVLTWIGEGGRIVVRLRLRGRRMTLEAEAPPAEQDRCFQAVRAILVALADLYGIPPAPVDDNGDLQSGARQSGLAG